MANLLPAANQAVASVCTRLQKDLFDFSPKAQGLPVEHINLLLCGGVGAGKSSIVSTVDSLCQGRISRRAPHGQGTGSLTRQLRKYQFVNPDSNRKVHWQLWDSMGWGASDYKKGELGFILDGNLPNKCKLDDNISLKTDGFNSNPSIADTVHCMLLVVPCDAASDESYMARLREMRQFARDRGKLCCLSTHVCTAWSQACFVAMILQAAACACYTEVRPSRTLPCTGIVLGQHHSRMCLWHLSNSSWCACCQCSSTNVKCLLLWLQTPFTSLEKFAMQRSQIWCS